ncbi:MKI67 FHA domain-interacting nucleolar phosphoprotein [Aphanomyces cochlioides]|nr:MKI67 FHA domain-interacting nucleolar phosphoprotein [Aphanomyces cochlioides]
MAKKSAAAASTKAVPAKKAAAPMKVAAAEKTTTVKKVEAPKAEAKKAVKKAADEKVVEAKKPAKKESAAAEKKTAKKAATTTEAPAKKVETPEKKEKATTAKKQKKETPAAAAPAKKAKQSEEKATKESEPKEEKADKKATKSAKKTMAAVKEDKSNDKPEKSVKKAAPAKKPETAKKAGKKSIEQQLAKLQGAEWDSDDEDMDATSAKEPEVNFEANVDFIELTKKTKQNLAKGTAPAATDASTPSSTIFIGRIPHGFYEKQMRGFFSQFGEIKRLKVSRNKKSGKSKHYAFVEFEESEVARVVADTMNGYRLFDKTLNCSVVPLDKCHERMFIGANRTFRPFPYRKIAVREHNAPKTFEQQEAANKRLLAKEEAKRNKLKALGIEYEFPGYAESVPSKSSHFKF